MPIPLGILAVAGAGGGAVASDFELLETTLLSSNAASVTFSNLNNYSAYKHLQIRATLRGNLSSTSWELIAARLNGDTATNYSNHDLIRAGTSLASGANSSLDRARIGRTSFINGNIYSALILDVLDFASTSKKTTLRSLSGVYTGQEQVSLASGLWNNTNAVTSIQLYVEGVNITSGSRFSLYGIKG